MFDESPKTYNADARRRIAEAVHGWETGRVPPGRDGGPALSRPQGSGLLIGKVPAVLKNGQFGVANVYRGAEGSETYSPGDDIWVYVRDGILLPGAWHYFARFGFGTSLTSSSSGSGSQVPSGYEPILPSLTFRGKTTLGAINKGMSGAINIYAGALGSETDTGVTMPNVYCRLGNVGASKWVICGFDFDAQGWEIEVPEC